MKDLMFPKIYSVKKVKRPINRVKKTSLAKLKREADKLAGEKCRARGVCEICGTTENLQWAHMLSRRYQSLRWNMNNCFCLCRDDHARFTYNPDLWITWLMENYQERYLRLAKQREIFVKVDREFMEKVLEDLKHV